MLCNLDFNRIVKSRSFKHSVNDLAHFLRFFGLFFFKFDQRILDIILAALLIKALLCIIITDIRKLTCSARNKLSFAYSGAFSFNNIVFGRK